MGSLRQKERQKKRLFLGLALSLIVTGCYLYSYSPTTVEANSLPGSITVNNRSPTGGGWQTESTSSEYINWLWKEHKDIVREHQNPNPPYDTYIGSPGGDGIDNLDLNAAPEITAYQSYTPYLVLGYDFTYADGNPSDSVGYHNPEIEIDLWVPESVIDDNTINLKLTGKHICSVSGLLDTSIDSIDEYTKIYLRHSGHGTDNGEWTRKRKSDEANKYLAGSTEEDDVWKKGTGIAGELIMTADNTNCSNGSNNLTSSIDKSLITVDNATGKDNRRELLNQSSGASEWYYRYQLRAIVVNPSDSYYNQFNLEVSTIKNNLVIDKGVYLTFPETPQNDNGQGALGVSTRINNIASGGTHSELVALWEISFDVAGNAEEGCSKEETRNVGLYDHDYVSSSRNWQTTFNRGLAPSVDISYMDRADYIDNLSNPSFTDERTIVFNDDTLQSNAWEQYGHTFQWDRVYRLRFYNLNSQSWVQVRVPFSQVNSLQKCIHRPLFKVHYADIYAGGRFGTGNSIDACRNDDLSTVSASNVYGHSVDRNRGSSVQYAAYIHDEVSGFYSNYPKGITNPPDPPNQLTFANDSSWGGNFGQARCIPNYWRKVDQLGEAQEVNNSELELGIIGSYQTKFYKPSIGDSFLTITNDPPKTIPNLKTTVYVEGNLHISDDIFNNAGGQWGQFNEMGYLILIAKGDITISSEVARLDAILIAYPTRDENGSVTGGNIYTCKPASLISSSQEYAAACNQTSLLVNGALIAHKVYFGRTHPGKTLTDGVTEEINLLPEYFVGTPQLPSFEDWVYGTDSVSVLPPNF